MSKNILKGVGRVITQTCVIFTLFVLLVYVVGSAVPDFGNAIDLKNILIILFFAFVFALSNLLLRLERLPVILRILLHYAATTVGFYFVFVMIAAKATAPSAIFVMLLFYTLLYTVLMGLYQVFFQTLLRPKATKGTEYERIYK